MIATGNESRDVKYAISTYINFAAVSITKEMDLQTRLITCTNQDYVKDMLLEIKRLKIQRNEMDQVMDRLTTILKKWKVKEYPSDEIRWKMYYKDLLKLVSQLDGDK